MKHLILYDGKCPLCNRAIRVILKHDLDKCFLFAPLQGETAHALLRGSKLLDPPYDSLVLFQNYQTPKQKMLIRSKASFRIAWLLGGKFKIMGLLSFLPSFLFDLCYRWVASRRYHLFSETVQIDPEQHKDQFLD